MSTKEILVMIVQMEKEQWSTSMEIDMKESGTMG